jgi:hypothetical protein
LNRPDHGSKTIDPRRDRGGTLPTLQPVDRPVAKIDQPVSALAEEVQEGGAGRHFFTQRANEGLSRCAEKIRVGSVEVSTAGR